jgi:hypothetical protein
MPPYSKLKEYLVAQYRAIVDNEKSTVDQRLKALGHLDSLQIKRKPRPKKATSGSFKKGVLHKQHKTPKAIDSRLLGAAPAINSSLSDAALLGTVEGVEALPEPLQPAGAPSGS